MKTTHLLIMSVCILFLPGMAEATITFSSGTHTIDYTINDIVKISGPNTQVTLTTGGWVQSIFIDYNGASFTMTGGYTQNGITSLSSSPMHIYGGVIDGDLKLDSSTLNQGDDNVYIYGSDFKINGIAVAYGLYDIDGILTGILSNGDPLDCYVGCAGGNDVVLMPVPEPATLCLLVTGSLLMQRKKQS